MGALFALNRRLLEERLETPGGDDLHLGSRREPNQAGWRAGR